MSTDTINIKLVIDEIRHCFNVLKFTADELHSDIGVNASARAVMETLYPDNAITVPDIARSKSVSRQHIQVIVNNLSQHGLVNSDNNPKDKRTFLISLSKLGRCKFEVVLRREKDFMKEISTKFTEREIATASSVINKLTSLLEGVENE
ncbi:MarR family winged helix-turn-helix transcriptional regulator [Pseudemcibacter aquimaris]|uniref:MarR family winged helix-turn-helix transcriptional regulator n=1 Tax=Pseudemcibacter aquimaris TaxID=2857064 RepID=UPI002013308B|nr:MarR family transcriptional regulator [Pseudemcibacter aquimaris]MCC3859932.1 hypothetical protein [Pseudemcibacter aquimaris]WDU57264.1 MarR family transcriptional regulator [Pseudemcibacter aquimaris]